MRAPSLLLVGLLSAPALGAEWQFLGGIRAGVSAPPLPSVEAGPLLGADVEVAAFRQVSLLVLVEQSRHRILTPQVAPAWLTTGGVGAGFRFDVARVVPYATVALLGTRFHRDGGPAQVDLQGAASGGLYVPLWSWGFIAPELRYGYSFSSGRFPSGVTFFVRAGARSGEF